MATFEGGQLDTLPVQLYGHDGRRPFRMGTGQQQRFDIGATVIYVGSADRGVAESVDAWVVEKYILNGSGDPTAKYIGYGSWTNYLTLDYA
jgi:hypothetical protein